MEIKDCTIPNNFHLLDIKGDDSVKEFTDKFVNIVKTFQEQSISYRILKGFFEQNPENLDKNASKLIDYIKGNEQVLDLILSSNVTPLFQINQNDLVVHSWRITTSAGMKLGTLFTTCENINNITITLQEYQYYFLFESEAEELFFKLDSLIRQYSYREELNAAKSEKTELESSLELSPIRYMADSSGCDGRGFSHGFEALLDFQLSWNCRYACYGERNTTLPSKLKQQCLHILNVLVNPKTSKNDIHNLPIQHPKSVFVYKQWKKTDLIIELITEKDEKYVILVEDKAFTSIKEHQIIDYPRLVKEDYDHNNTAFSKGNYTFLPRVVTIQDDPTSIGDIKDFIVQKEEEYKEKQKKEIEWIWEVLCGNDLLVKDQNDNFERTNNPLLDEFWIENKCPVDPDSE